MFGDEYPPSTACQDSRNSQPVILIFDAFAFISRSYPGNRSREWRQATSLLVVYLE